MQKSQKHLPISHLTSQGLRILRSKGRLHFFYDPSTRRNGLWDQRFEDFSWFSNHYLAFDAFLSA